MKRNAIVWSRVGCLAGVKGKESEGKKKLSMWKFFRVLERGSEGERETQSGLS